MASVQGQLVTVLVDSGSSTSFINQSLIKDVSCLQPLQRPARVKVANGAELMCSQEWPSCVWESQGHEFKTSLKVLALGCFDIILGMVWLESHNPAVDWVQKKLTLQVEGQLVELTGQTSSDNSCPTITSEQLNFMCVGGEVEHLVLLTEEKHYQLSASIDADSDKNPPEVQEILQQFQDVFADPKGLSPRRACDHAIPLITGAQSVSIRPYRHSPETKDEIERQVDELLASGVIQKSVSSFAFPVILVKKRDGQWRMCVDYRRLNAMTIIPKFPIPVIDELLDELSGAKWFSKLDLRAGYHQIRMASGE